MIFNQISSKIDLIIILPKNYKKNVSGSDAGPTPILDPTVNFEPEELYEEDSAITDQVQEKIFLITFD